MIRVEIRMPKQPTQHRSFEQASITIGRDPGSDLCLPFPGVSARHCRIETVSGGLRVVDLNSTNGTFVNARAIVEPTLIESGEPVVVADIELIAGDKYGQSRSRQKNRPQASESAHYFATRAEIWMDRGQQPIDLLRGSDLRRAKKWLQREFSVPHEIAVHVDASKTAAGHRFRRHAGLIAAGLLGVVVPIVALVIGTSSDTETTQKGSLTTLGSRADDVAERVELAQRLLREGHGSAAATAAIGALDAAIARRESAEGSTTLDPVDSRVARVTHEALRAYQGLALLERSGPVHAVAIGPGGRIVATGAGDGSVVVSYLDHASPRATSVVLDVEQGGAVNDLEFAPTGAWLAAASADGLVRLWSFDDNAQLAPSAVEFEHGNPVSCLRFRRDGAYLVTGSDDGAVRMWMTGRGGSAALQSTLDGHAAPIVDIELADDGSMLAARHVDGVVRAWKILGDRVSEPEWLVGSEDDTPRATSNLALGPDGRSLMAATSDGAVLWWVRRGGRWEVHQNLSAGRPHISTVEVTGDGRWAIAATAREVMTWQLSEPKPETTMVRLPDHGVDITLVAASPDATTVATATSDGTVRLWNTNNWQRPGQPPQYRGHDHPVTALAFTPDGTSAVSCDRGGQCRVWPVGAPSTAGPSRVASADREPITSLWLDPSGQRAMTTSGGKANVARVWDVEAGVPKIVNTLDAHRQVVNAGFLAPRGDWAVTAGRDGRVIHWMLRADDTTAEVLIESSHAFTHVAASEDGRWLAAVGADRIVRMWPTDRNGQVGEPIELVGHKDRITSVAFGPDVLVTGSNDQTVRVWSTDEMSAGRLRLTLDDPRLAVHDVDVGTEFIAAASEDAVGVRVWDRQARGGSQAVPLRGHDGPVQVVALDEKNNRLASGGDDGTVRIWSLEKMPEPVDATWVLSGHDKSVRQLAFAGSQLLSAGADGRVVVWDLGADNPSDSMSELDGHHGAVVSGLVVDDRHEVAVTTDFAGVLRVWPLTAAGLREMSCAVLGRGLDEETWSDLSQVDYHPKCADDIRRIQGRSR